MRDNNLMRCGIFYNFAGDPRCQLLFDSIASARRHEPHLPLHVISDIPLDVPFTWVRGRSDASRSFYSTQCLRFSPFDVTFFLSSELQLQRPLGDLDALLENHDVAMRPHPQAPTLSALAAHEKMMSVLPAQERILMKSLAAARPDAPFFDTQVMLLRRSARTEKLFAAWHEEWLRFETAEQTALARAVHGTGARIRELPDDFARRSPPRAQDRLVHFSQVAGAGGSIKLAPEHRAYRAFARAVQRGLCSRQQYAALGKLLVKLRPLKLLVFGCGADSALWSTLNEGGRTCFVESDPVFAKEARDAGLEVIPFNYPTQRGQWAAADARTPPQFVNEPWDVIFVDGPAGFSADQPGRELPILWAANHASQPLVVAHDYDRIWERSCCDRYLGTPDFWLYGSEERPQQMAFWLRGRAGVIDVLE